MGTCRMFGPAILTLAFLFSEAASPQKIECTEGLKAKASLKFSECQDPLLPVRQCYKLYPETLGYVARSSYLEKYGNNSHEAEKCKTRKNQTSCEHLTYLTQVCGAHYDACHDKEEKREIMRMWIKQFVRGTHEVYWEFAFSDNNKELIDGECNNILDEFFDDEEVDEIIGLVNTGPNLFDTRHFELSDLKHEMIYSTKISNLTQRFGVLKDKDGNRIGFGNNYPEEITLPSHWEYCSWKMKHYIDHEGLFNSLPMGLYHCDGKCNTNNGDNQRWIDSPNYSWVDVKTDENHFDDYPGTEDKDMFKCIWSTEYSMQRGATYYVENLDLDRVKIELCKPFKTILENCTIPLNECISGVAIKEIVMADVLKTMVGTTKRAMEIIENNTQADFFGGFTYDDCVIFGGVVAGAPLQSATLGYMIIPVVVMVTLSPMLEQLLRP